MAVNVAVCGGHNVVLSQVTTGAAALSVVITTASDAGLTPQAFVHVTVYVPAVLTVIAAAVAAFDHLISPVQALAVNVAVEVPQRFLSPVTATVGLAGLSPVIIVTTFEAGLSPQSFEQIAV